MGGIFSGIGQRAFTGLANQGVNNLFGGGLPQGPSIGRPVEQQPMPAILPEFSTSIGLPGGPNGQTQFFPMPGYQQPTPQQQAPTQYYQQMRESMEGMDNALKELEGMQMPGQQYQGGGGYTPGGGKRGKAANF